MAGANEPANSVVAKPTKPAKILELLKIKKNNHFERRNFKTQSLPHPDSKAQTKSPKLL